MNPALWLTLLGLAAVDLLQPQPPAGQVAVRVAVERTAVWVGDRLQYTLEFTSPESLDVLPEDLAKERLPVRGAEVRAVEVSAAEIAGSTIRRVRYTLATFAVDTKEITIDSFAVRYFARHTVGATTQVAPLGEITVPRTIVAIRSTLPDSGRLPDFRTPVGLRAAPRYAPLAQPIGVALIAIAIVPVAVLVLNVAGRIRQLRAGTPRRRARRQHTSEMDELSTLAPVTQEECVRAYERLDRVLRQHLELRAGLPAAALTPAEIARALREGPSSSSADDVEAVLDTCERARYAPGPIPDDQWLHTLRVAEGVVRRRP